MIKIKTVVAVIFFSISLAGCNGQNSKATGVACMGEHNGSLIERLGNRCKAGDSIATNNPAYFCNFEYAIAYNDNNAAFCIYSGKQAEERTTLSLTK